MKELGARPHRGVNVGLERDHEQPGERHDLHCGEPIGLPRP